jgi:two-component system, cell cycle sensor histidine kinase and response regulator CckA
MMALLEATFESTYDGMLVIDLKREIVRYNRQLLTLFGFTAEMLERDGVDGIIAALQPQVEGGRDLAAKAAEIWAARDRDYVGRLALKDGRVFEVSIVPARIGSKLVGIVASLRDVSEKARAEQSLQQHRAFLEKAQEIAHIGSWVTDIEQKQVGWSRETHRIFGVPDGQFGGSLEAFFSLVHPDDRDAVRAAADAAQKDYAPYDIVHRIVRGDGGIRWVHEQADVIRDSEGRALRMVGTVQDITERRLLEEQLRQSQKMEAIGRLAGGIAHDLNNALTAIAGYAELALGQVADDHPARPDVKEIRRAAERAGSVTKQLLAFSRKQLLAPRVFSLNDTVAGLARLLSRLLGSDVQVQSKTGSNVPPIIGDPGQVEQAIINLAVNAKDAMPNGGRLTLDTSVAEVDEAFARTHVPMAAGRYVVLRVTDTGHGMARDTQHRIFEPFFTTKDIGKGTGLGLSMVYGTLKQIGGFIFVDSEVGRGTTFSLFFPPAPIGSVVVPAGGVPAPAETVTVPEATVNEPVAAAADSGGEPTLLVVEDESAVRNLVASSLRKEGYQLLLAASAEEALEIVNRHEGAIDLLLTDAIMPGRTGIDLARELVARKPGLPVILMSGYTEETLPVGDLESAITLLQKPFTPRDLRQRIRRVLDR